MESPIRAGVLLVALLAVSPSVRGEEERVAVRMEWEPGVPGGLHQVTVTPTAEAPQGVSAPPAAREPRWAVIELGDAAPLHLVYDAHPEHPRVWLDREFDGGLADDRAIAWKETDTSRSVSETVLLRYSDEDRPVPVEIHVVQSKATPDAALSVRPALHRRGTVELAGRLRDVALRDDGATLRFDGEKAVLLFDVNGDDAWATPHGSPEHLHRADLVRIGDRAWRWHPATPSGAVVELIRVDDPPAAGPVRWPRAGAPSAGVRPNPPDEDFTTLKARFEEESELPYAQRQATVALVGRVGSPEAFALLREVVEKDGDANLRAAAARALGSTAYVAHADVVTGWARGGDRVLAPAAIQALHGMDAPGREPLLRELLGSAHAAVAGAAAKHLAYLPSESAVGAARAALEDLGDGAARYQAYFGLRTLPDGPGVEVVVRCARDAYASLRAMALGDLHALHHPDARALALEAAGERPINLVVGRAAATVLGATGGTDGVEALLTMAVEGPDTLRTEIVKRVVRLRDAESLAALVRNLRSREPERRAIAARILAGIPRREHTEALVKALKREGDPSAAEAVVDALGDQGDPAAAGLLLRLAKKRGPLRDVALRALARSGLADPSVRKFMVGLLDAKRWEDRVLAIDAAAAAGEQGLNGDILPSLDHERREVRLAAVEALRRLRERASVEPLIARLQVEELPRVAGAIGRALFELTGVNLYAEPGPWQRWWTDHGVAFEVPGDVPQLPDADRGDTVGGFFGIPVESDRVVFVIDQSGSMSAADALPDAAGQRPDRLEVAVREVLGAVARLPNRARVNVILFQSIVDPWQKGLVPLVPAARKQLEEHLRKKRPTGGTNLFDALEAGLIAEGVDTVMLLSDGVPGAGKWTGTEDILREVRRLNQTRRIAIHGVSLGRDSDLLRRLAEENGGRYVRR